MQFQLPIQIKPPDKKISYSHRLLLIGSCFTEHIGNNLQELKFSVLQNPNGILFDPASVCRSLHSYIDNRQYAENDLFYLNEVWYSWHHHSRFSNTSKEQCLKTINDSQQQAHAFLKEADWLIITLGSSFSYRLTEQALKTAEFLQKTLLAGWEAWGLGVANCHRAPAQWFTRHLLGIDEIISMLDTAYHRLKQFNPKLSIIFTISPVRHIRDGVVDNNRSKARLIEAVHHMVNKFPGLYYFPAYELVIDVLRDYRFYDKDLVHPNYMATEFVLEQFSETYIDEETRALMEKVREIVQAQKHKPLHPTSPAHQQFLHSFLEKTKDLQKKYPFLNLDAERDYFSS